MKYPKYNLMRYAIAHEKAKKRSEEYPREVAFEKSGLDYPPDSYIDLNLDSGILFGTSAIITLTGVCAAIKGYHCGAAAAVIGSAGISRAIAMRGHFWYRNKKIERYQEEYKERNNLEEEVD